MVQTRCAGPGRDQHQRQREPRRRGGNGPWALPRGQGQSVRQAHDDGMPIYAECGGLMYLSRAVVGPDGAEIEMAGLLPLRVSPETGIRQMGYREMHTLADSLLAVAGKSLRGHELHWSSVTNGIGKVTYAYELFDPAGYRVGHEGYANPGLLASNIHLHFGQDPQEPAAMN